MGLGRLVPQALQPLARRLYRWCVHPAPRQRLSSALLAPLPGLKCIVSYNEYGAYCIPLSSLHRVAARRVLGNDVYEPLTLAFMRAHCGSGDIVHAGTLHVQTVDGEGYALGGASHLVSRSAAGGSIS